MKYETRHLTAQDLSAEEEATVREHLIWRRFENVDEYLAHIDQHIRELAKLGALDTDTVNAIRVARAAVMKFRPVG